MSFDLNITVNGNRCKQYHHQGRTYVEAKNGSEYVIEIKNNYWKRVLAVCSVDGLNVLTGKTASNKDSGYIIGAYSSEKIKGFRYSDSEWAMFKFGYKFNGKTYAQSKENGSEKNCGIAGIKIFYENEPVYYSTPPVVWNTTPNWLAPTPAPAPPIPVTYTTTTTTTTQYPATYAISTSYSCNSIPNYAMTGAMSGAASYTSNVNYCASNVGTQDLNLYESSTTKGGLISPDAGYSSLFGGCAAAAAPTSVNPTALTEAIASAKAVRATALANAKSADKMVSKFKKLSGTKCSARGGQSATLGFCDTSYVEYEREIEKPKAEFDMGTEWGRREHSTVRNVNFERGCLAQSFDIYYASREALIAMGVPINNELLLPQSFPNQYAEPPKNWIG